MAISKAVVSRVRVLAITHILVGVLLIVFGIADSATPDFDEDNFNSGLCSFGIATGIWVSFVHCRNSAFVRYNLTFFSPSYPLARGGENRRENKSNHSNRFQFPCLKAFRHVF